MIVLIAAVVLLAAIAAPHLARLEDAPPAPAALAWLCGLLLRALTTVAAIVFAVISLPGTAIFQALTHWCWRAVLPIVTTPFRLDGHALGDAAILLPAAGLILSVASVGLGLVKTAQAVGRLIRSGIGAGPSDSVIVGDGVVFVAAAGLRKPRVIVSAGALTTLEDYELYAGLEHERGHIRRRHRWVLVAGELSRAVGRCIPGAGSALRELAFQLERDADDYALRHRHAAADLASAICKAALGSTASSPALASLAGTGTARRVSQLLDGGVVAASRWPRVLAATMVALVLAVLAVLPAATLAASAQGAKQPPARHCAR